MTSRPARLILLHAAAAFSLSASTVNAEVADVQSRAVALIGVSSYVNDHCSAFWSKPSALLARLESIGVEDPRHLPVRVWVDGETKANQIQQEVGENSTIFCQMMFEGFGGNGGGSTPFIFRKGQRPPANPFDGE